MDGADSLSLLALAYMPPDSDNEDEPVRGQEEYKTAAEQELEHDLNELADYDGDSDDESPESEAILGHVNDNREPDSAEVSHDGFTACDTNNNEDAAILLPGAPVGWKPPGPPADWKPAKPKKSLGQPDVKFNKIDNPGGWSAFTFRPKFLYTGRKPTKYLYHALPTDATPVPKDDGGKRTCNGFEFFYTGWSKKSTDPTFRHGATRDNLHPESRKGCLDADLLSKLGLTKERMHSDHDLAPDALFFYQLLLPIHDTTRNGSGIDGDPRKPYYPHVAECTEVYAICDLKTRGSGLGHRFKETSPQELLKWDGVLVFDGVLGGSRGAMLRRFDRRRPDNSSFNKHIADAMTSTRWLELKRAIKLNNNLTATRKGDPNHDPAQKFDYIFDVIVYNTNALSKHCCLDLCGDETTWICAGWAEPGSGIIKRGLEKPSGSKGGQLVVVSDVNRMRVRAHIHRHKLHKKHYSIEGCNEVKLIGDQLLQMVDNGEPYVAVGYDSDYRRIRPILREKPHITWDNYFSGDQTMNYAAENGIGVTLTVNRGRLPAGVPSKCLHKSRTDADERSRAARFENPIVAIKRDPTKWKSSVWQHTSFQSTSSCNIAHVNAINVCGLFAQEKQRGRALFKRTWAIEMNESRQLYLSTYGKIDKIDHMIRNCNLYYRTWKYWHAPMNHGKALAIVTAYDMYLECAEGKLNPEWKVNKPVDFHRFREKLGMQMLKYDPRERRYPGDERFRACTQQNQAQRRRTSSPARSIQSTSSGVCEDDLSSTTDSSTRLCGFLDEVIQHMESCKRFPGTNGRLCVVCGVRTAKFCSKCGKAMHTSPPEHANTQVSCFMHYHNTGFFGLAREDCRITKRRQRDWAFPTAQQRQLNSAQMKQIHKQRVDKDKDNVAMGDNGTCLLYTSPSPRD